MTHHCNGFCGCGCVRQHFASVWPPDPWRHLRLPRGWRAHQFIGPYLPYGQEP